MTTLNSYIETALWASNASGDLDLYGPEDVAPEAVAEMSQDLDDFLNQIDHIPWQDYWDYEHLAHDFWLTRNRHGAGFWDRYSDGPGAEIGEALTEIAHAFGTADLCVGDDGWVWQIR